MPGPEPTTSPAKDSPAALKKEAVFASSNKSFFRFPAFITREILERDFSG
jgi:hypothetical protein